jgi:hypothetical protein
MMKKWRINWKTVARNLFILMNIVLLGILIHKISTNGIGFISTIGYFD